MTATARTMPITSDRSGITVFAPPSAANLVLSLLAFRWAIGIAENFGLPMISEAAAIIMVVCLGMMFLVRMRLSENSLLFVIGIAAWVFTGALSMIATPAASPVDAVSLLVLLSLYALFANAAATYLTDRTCLKAASRFLVAFVAVGAGLCLVQVITGSGFVESGKEHILRAFGSDVHPVSFAIQMVTVLVAIEIVRCKRQHRLSLIYVGLLVLGATAIYLTYARTAWVMAFLTFSGVLVFTGSWPKRALWLLIFAVIGFALVQTSDRFADLDSLPFFLSNFSFSDTVFDYRYVDNSVSWRIVNWSYGFQQAMEQPMLGFGPGQSAASSYFSLEMHNILLEVLFEGGFLGLGAFLIALAGLFRMHWRLPAVTQSDRYVRVLTNSFGISLLLAVVFSTSFVDQLMSVLIYILMLTLAAISTKQT